MLSRSCSNAPDMHRLVFIFRITHELIRSSFRGYLMPFLCSCLPAQTPTYAKFEAPLKEIAVRDAAEPHSQRNRDDQCPSFGLSDDLVLDDTQSTTSLHYDLAIRDSLP